MTALRTPWRAVAAAFALNGVLLGAWASRIPAVVERHGLSEAGLGLLLLAMGVGALVSFPLAGRLADELGAVRVTRWLMLGYLASLVLVGVAPGVATLAVALCLFGMCHGAMDVTMNSWAAEVERGMGRAVMSSFHAMWSLGAGCGAASGYLAVGAGLGYPGQFLLVVLVLGALLAPFTLIDWTSERRARQAHAPMFALPRGALVLVGIVGMSAGIGEGAMVDWSAVFLRDVVGTTEDRAALGYVVYSVTMVAMRLQVDRLVTRFSPTVVARAGGLSALLGLALVTVPLSLGASLAGFALVGIGYAAITPLAFSRAAADPVVPPGQAIASVATLGYGAMLMGPPAIGLIAEASSLRLAFVLLGGFALLIALFASVLERPGETAAQAGRA